MPVIAEYVEGAKKLEIELACSGCACCFPCPLDWQDNERFCFCNYWDRVKERKHCNAWEARESAAREKVRTFWPDWCYPLEHRRIPNAVAIKGLEYLRVWYPEKKLHSLGHVYKDKEIPTERIMEAFEKGDVRKRAEVYLRKTYNMPWGRDGDAHVKFRTTALAWVESVMDGELNEPTYEENEAALKDAYESIRR